MHPRVLTARDRRLARLSRSGPQSAALRAPEAHALASVGLRAVGDVMGAVALRVPAQGFFFRPGARATYPRGWQGTATGPPPVFTSGRHAQVPTWVSAMRTGHRRILGRLVEEARALGADGVVGIRFRHEVEDDGSTGEFGAPVWSFIASGTAVASTGRVRATRVFTATLSATETATALLHGWAPMSVLSCPVMAARWVEPESWEQMRRAAANGEIEAHTQTVLTARREAASDFAAETRRLGADAAVTTTSVLEHRPARDLSEVSVLLVGTALAAFDPGRAHDPPRTAVDLRRGRVTM